MDKISDSESSSDDEPLQVESKIEKPKRVYNRKPMTEEQKQAFKERMAKARSSKRKKFSDNDPLKLYIENKPKPVVKQPVVEQPVPKTEPKDSKDDLIIRMMEKLLEQPVKKPTKPRVKKATEPKKTTAKTKQKAEQVDEPVKIATSKVPSMMFV